MSALECQYLVVGGGAVGLGVAYALAKAGERNIIVLEKESEVGAATTSQGAGLCGQVRDSVDRIRLAMHSVSIFRELERSEVKPEWIESGSLRIASSAHRADEFRRLKTAADQAGLEVHLIDATAAKRLWPLMDFSSAKSILWCPSDGCMMPRSVAQSYAHACRQLGVQILTNAKIESIFKTHGRVTGAETSRGTIWARKVVNAAGAHAYHVAKLADLELPIVPVRHEYYVTVPMKGLSKNLPSFRIPDLTLYGRVREDGLLLGGWEPKALHLDPRSFELEDRPPEVRIDAPVLNSFESSFVSLLPTAQAAQRSWIGKGWPTFTPDGRFIIGESSQVPGFVMAGGCNAHGISGSGGIGKLLVESLLDPTPSPYVQSLSPDRFARAAWNWPQAETQARRVYETYYGV